MLRRPLLLALLLLALTPGAAAHAEETTQMQSFEIGPYYASLEPSPMPLYANATGQAFILRIVNATTGKFVAADLVAARAEIFRGGDREEVRFEPVDERQALARVEVPQQGSLAMRVIFENGGQTWARAMVFDVYPDVPFRIRPVDPNFDLQPNRTETLQYEVVDPDTLARVDAFDDLRLRIEHWSPDHARLLDTQEKTLTRDGVGVWSVTHTFQEGHYYLRFASDDAGFNYTDLPLLHTNVLFTGETEPRETPAPVAASVLAVLALAALAGARRRRG